MEENKTLENRMKEIAEFWLNFEFLKKFKAMGDKYSKLIKQEKTMERNGTSIQER